MSSLNQVYLIGRLGKDPEHKKFESSGVCKLYLATSKKISKNGQFEEKTSWHNIVVWGKQGEACMAHLSKGDQIAVRGEIEYRTFENKSGVKQTATDINADKVVFLNTSKNKNANTNTGHFPKAEEPAKEPQYPEYLSTYDDIAF